MLQALVLDGLRRVARTLFSRVLAVFDVDLSLFLNRDKVWQVDPSAKLSSCLGLLYGVILTLTFLAEPVALNNPLD